MPTAFNAKLRRVGNSYVVSIPKPAVEGLEWREGDTLRVIVTDHTVTIMRKPTAR